MARDSRDTKMFKRPNTQCQAPHNALLDRSPPQTAHPGHAAPQRGSRRPGPANARQRCPARGEASAWWLVPARRSRRLLDRARVVALVSGASSSRRCRSPHCCSIAVYALLGRLRRQPSRGGFDEGGTAWPVIRLLVAAYSPGRLRCSSPLDGGTQLRAVGDVRRSSTRSAGRSARRSSQRLDRVERWVLVGDKTTARAAEGLRAVAQVRRRSSPRYCPADDASRTADRVAALEVVEQYHADRVVIARHHADDEGLLDLVRAFKSIGVPVSLLPRPLDLLEAPAATPSQVGGVPLIDVEALATRGRGALWGPDRRHTRKTEGQRGRPGDERGEQHRPRARAAARGPARGDPRRRQLA